MKCSTPKNTSAAAKKRRPTFNNPSILSAPFPKDLVVSGESYYETFTFPPHRIACTPSHSRFAPPCPLPSSPTRAASTADHVAHAAHARSPAEPPSAALHPDKSP